MSVCQYLCFCRVVSPVELYGCSGAECVLIAAIHFRFSIASGFVLMFKMCTENTEDWHAACTLDIRPISCARMGVAKVAAVTEANQNSKTTCCP